MPEFQQVVQFKASPKAVYNALATTEGHTAFTGVPAKISTEEGGTWTAYGGGIHGHNVEMVPGERLVQTWRAGSWAPGAWSLVRFSFKAHDGGTQVTMDHLAAPEGTAEHLKSGWQDNYWTPLETWFAKQ